MRTVANVWAGAGLGARRVTGESCAREREKRVGVGVFGKVVFIRVLEWKG